MKPLALCLGVIAFQTLISTAERILRTPTYWSSKNVFISVTIPDISSHTTWVLEIGQELVSRGHNVTFICMTGSEKYLRSYPDINLLSLGESPLVYNHTLAAELQSTGDNPYLFPMWFIRTLTSTMKREILTYSKFIEQYKPDVMICDHFADSCMRAAEEHSIPFITTSTAGRGPFRYKDADAPYINDLMVGEPTTEHQSIWVRFFHKYVTENVLDFLSWSVLRQNNQVRKELGLKSADATFSTKMGESMKLINNFFGLEPPRSLGPLIRFIGPIMPSSYPSLDEETAKFLDTHKKIGYGSFGHHASLTADGYTKVFTALFDSVESGVIEGFMWASVSQANFPKEITSSKGHLYDVEDMILNPSKYPHHKFVKWAPQYAILKHPSTALFLTHGGANSIFESLYVGTKMLLHPFFTDQPNNAKMLQAAGAALTYDQKKMKTSEIADMLRRVVEDVDGNFQKNTDRLSALVQLRASDAIRNGASAVEEVLFTSENDELPHLFVASRNMNYFKANNIDIQLLLVAVLGSLGFATYKVIRYGITSFNKQSKIKRE